MKVNKFKAAYLVGVLALVSVISYISLNNNMTSINELSAAYKLNSELDKFNLVMHNGKKFKSANFSNYPSLFFFGFINCPDVCPATLIKISHIIDQLNEKKDMARFYFVTVDPERDKEQNMKDYLSLFNPRITGLTGSTSDIKSFLNYMYVYSEKVYLDEKEYTFDHSSQIYLFKKDGSFFGTISLNESKKIIFDKINNLIIGA